MPGRCGRLGRLKAVTAGVLVSGVVSWCGCQQPAPRVAAYDGPTLTARQLGLEGAPSDRDGFALLTDLRTEGLFPGAVAIARLVPPVRLLAGPPREPAATETWHLGDIPWEEALGWNELVDNVLGIREVVVLDGSATVVPTSALDAIAEAAQQREASLCLVYGPAPSSEQESAALWGVIVRSADALPLASVQAQAGPSDFLPPDLERSREDLRHLDPNYLARRMFQRHARAALLALQARDDRPAATQPSPWRERGHPTPPLQIIPYRPTAR